MKNMNPVGWFEIPVTDIGRAQKFYEAVLDIKLDRQQVGPLEMAWFPMVENGIGSTGSLVKAESYVPSHEGTMVYFSCPNIDEGLKKAEENGGKILNPKMSIGEYGFVGHFEDSEGNRVALHTAAGKEE